MRVQQPLLAVLLTVPLLGGTVLSGAETKPTKEPVSFGSLRTLSPDDAKVQAQAWLKQAGKTDAATQKAFDAIWAKQRPVLDRVTETLMLGDDEAKALMTEARDPNQPAPTAVPAILKDRKRPAFYRSNLSLAYGKALSNRRVYEEALGAFKAVKVEDVSDPATYLFHRAVSEHGLLLKDDANRSILRLLDDATDVPDRYKMVSVLMAFDMQSWKEKDLAEIARKMDNIERRLDLARGGPQTQKIQKEVVARLDEIIKELENQQKGDGDGNCPNGGSPGRGGPRPTQPQLDSYGGTTGGPGNVDPKKLESIAKNWGKLPDKEKPKAMQELTRGMPSRYREVIERYLTEVSKKSVGDSK
jgi:hypothetical protein